MNKKGFTLVELLAAIVILGILMAVAYPNVMGILNKNRASTYIEDAKRLATLGEYKIRSGSTKKPAAGNCVLMNLAYLDNSEFENPPNGGEYDKEDSFVLIKREGSTYKYYVRLVEKIKESPYSGRGITLINSEDLYKDTPVEIKNFGTSDRLNLSSYNGLTDSATKSALNTKMDSVTCANYESVNTPTQIFNPTEIT